MCVALLTEWGHSCPHPPKCCFTASNILQELQSAIILFGAPWDLTNFYLKSTMPLRERSEAEGRNVPAPFFITPLNIWLFDFLGVKDSARNYIEVLSVGEEMRLAGFETSSLVAKTVYLTRYFFSVRFLSICVYIIILAVNFLVAAKGRKGLKRMCILVYERQLKK